MSHPLARSRYKWTVHHQTPAQLVQMTESNDEEDDHEHASYFMESVMPAQSFYRGNLKFAVNSQLVQVDSPKISMAKWTSPY